jgi:hypothetical protein
VKKILPGLLILCFCLIIINVFSQDFTYVGAAKCKMCHKSEKQGQQFPLWEARKHSKSFVALTSDEAKALAADAPENPKCLKCHSPLAQKAPELKEEGVSCEVCHGPGSAYKKMSIMKDHAEAVKNGLTEYGSPEAIKAQCLSCHENAHDKPFDFDAAWEKVKHPRPEKN